MKRAAVIGLGDIAPVHLAAIAANEHITLCAVCDIDPVAQSRAPEGVPFYTDWQELLAAQKPDCVHICLPHYLHVPVAQACALAGAHVLCEKPVALNSEAATAFAAFEAAHPKVKIAICLQNRKNETVEVLKNMIDSGEYGAVVGTKGIVPWQRTKAYYDVKPWRGTWAEAGGGCMINQAVHTLDLLYYLGGEIESLRGTAQQLLDYGIEVEDTVAAQLHYKSGATGLFMATLAHHTNENVELSVTLEKARFVIADEVLYCMDDSGRTTIAENVRLPGSKFYYGASHVKIINQFYQQLETDGDDYIHVRDAVMSIRLIDAVQTSSKRGAAVSIRDQQV